MTHLQDEIIIRNHGDELDELNFMDHRHCRVHSIPFSKT